MDEKNKKISGLDLLKYIDAKKFIKEKNYIQGIILMHLYIESELINLIMENTELNQDGNFPPIKEKELVILNYKEALMICLCMDLIDENLFEKLKEFNSTRNKIAHKLFKGFFEEQFLIKQLKGAEEMSKEIALKIISTQKDV